jgi:hypothetical protein
MIQHLYEQVKSVGRNQHQAVQAGGNRESMRDFIKK